MPKQDGYVVLDAQFDRSTLYVLIRNGSTPILHASSDSGKTWQKLDTPPIIRMRVSEKQIVATTLDHKLVISVDAGKSWITKELPEGFRYVEAINLGANCIFVGSESGLAILRL